MTPEYRKKHKESIRERDRLYRQNNKDKVRDWSKQARDRRRRRIYDRDKGICNLCGCYVSFGKFNLDHRIPRSKGGKTVDSNLRVMCRECNMKKNDKDPEFYEQAFWRDYEKLELVMEGRNGDAI